MSKVSITIDVNMPSGVDLEDLHDRIMEFAIHIPMTIWPDTKVTVRDEDGNEASG